MEANHLRILLVCSVSITACNSRWSEHDISAAKNAGNRIIEALNSFRKKNNVYPKRLNDLVAGGFISDIPPPVVGKRAWVYNVSADQNEFSIAVWSESGKPQHVLSWHSRYPKWDMNFE